MSSPSSPSTGGAITGVGSLSGGLKVGGGTGGEGSRLDGTGSIVSYMMLCDVASGDPFECFTFDSVLELMIGMRAPWTSL